MDDELNLTITPETLRELADDLEQEGPNACRTVVTDEGVLVTLTVAEED